MIPNYLAVLDPPENKNMISVSWDSSSVCNYRCSYCEDNFNDGKHLFPSIEVVEKFFTDLETSTHKKIFIEMKGGEPTLWKDLPKFLKICQEKTWGISAVTNGSKPLVWWQKNYEFFNMINISVHPEYANQDELEDKILFLIDKRPIGVLCLMYPPLFDKACTLAERFADKFPQLDVKALVVAQPQSNSILYQYTTEQIEYITHFNKRKVMPMKMSFSFPIEDRAEAFSLDTNNNLAAIELQSWKLNGKNNWKGWLCSAGLDRLHIDVRGDIYRGQCFQGGLLGNLHQKNYHFPKNMIRCEREYCFCGNEMVLRKYVDEYVSLINN